MVEYYVMGVIRISMDECMDMDAKIEINGAAEDTQIYNGWKC